jgi:hypothetical protein
VYCTEARTLILPATARAFELLVGLLAAQVRARVAL